VLESGKGDPAGDDVADGTDPVVIGAGPSGLDAACCAGFRGLSTIIVDPLAEPGGQSSAHCPQEPIHDVAVRLDPGARLPRPA
jgi:NADPH-dependent 2,4-dienoyl-CoA reductase/sulfur reductase-like enzyme